MSKTLAQLEVEFIEQLPDNVRLLMLEAGNRAGLHGWRGEDDLDIEISCAVAGYFVEGWA